MSDTINADEYITKKLHEVNRLEGIVSQPENLVFVTTQDVVEIFHELQPYTLKKLDEVLSHPLNQTNGKEHK